MSKNGTRLPTTSSKSAHMTEAKNAHVEYIPYRALKNEDVLLNENIDKYIHIGFAIELDHARKVEHRLSI